MTHAIIQDGETVGWAQTKRVAVQFAWGLSMERILRDASYLGRLAEGDLDSAISIVVRHMAVMSAFAQRMRFWKQLERKGWLYTSRTIKRKR
jgi:hypothetical protein